MSVPVGEPQDGGRERVQKRVGGQRHRVAEREDNRSVTRCERVYGIIKAPIIAPLSAFLP